jgi:xanthine dehydrogenase YagR molybdenum-binding subunit
MAKLQKTTVEMEGRFEERWVLVEEEPAAWEDDRALTVAGTRVSRLTGPRRVSGAARYVSDVALPGMLQGVIVRSPHAHATVELEIEAARAVPGVHAVLSAADEGIDQGRSPIFKSEPTHAGAPVAALACEDAEAARAGLAALAPRYTVLGFVTDPARALAEQRLQEDPVENETGDLEAGLAEADVVVEGEYATSAQVHHALEPHCGVAQWLGDELHAFVSTQGIWDARAELARAFALDPDRVHVTCEFMGGGFGAKQGATTEGMIAAYLSRAAAGRAVRVFNDRRAEAVAAGHRAQTFQQSYRIGARRDGTLTAIEVTSVIVNPMRGWIDPTTTPARTLYRCPNVRAQAIPLLLDVEPSNAFRAPGIMEGTFGYESALDELATELGIDPLDLRRANNADVDQVSGLPYTAKNLEACIDRAAELAGWAGRDDLRDREHPDGRRRGLGAACQIWWGGGGPPAHALVRMGHDGVVTVVTGAQDIGTGVTTAFAQVAAEELGLPLERVRVEVGSTRYGVYAPVSGGSQTMPSVAPAVRSAAYDLRTKLLELAGDVFEVSPDDLQIVDGSFVSLDGALREPIAEVTGKLGKAQLVGTGSRGPNPDGMRVNTFGCQIAQVAVDVATGGITVERIVAVHDIGRVIAPLQARSQVEGGVLQGLGFALMEERIIDPTTGTVVNGNLEDYDLPTHADCPEIVVEFIDRPDPHASTLGLKGLGEPPIVPTAPAIANAIFHATGVRVRTSPITRRRFLEARAG